MTSRCSWLCWLDRGVEILVDLIKTTSAVSKMVPNITIPTFCLYLLICLPKSLQLNTELSSEENKLGIASLNIC